MYFLFLDMTMDPRRLEEIERATNNNPGLADGLRDAIPVFMSVASNQKRKREVEQTKKTESAKSMQSLENFMRAHEQEQGLYSHGQQQQTVLASVAASSPPVVEEQAPTNTRQSRLLSDLSSFLKA